MKCNDLILTALIIWKILHGVISFCCCNNFGLSGAFYSDRDGLIVVPVVPQHGPVLVDGTVRRGTCDCQLSRSTRYWTSVWTWSVASLHYKELGKGSDSAEGPATQWPWNGVVSVWL